MKFWICKNKKYVKRKNRSISPNSYVAEACISHSPDTPHILNTEVNLLHLQKQSEENIQLDLVRGPLRPIPEENSQVLQVSEISETSHQGRKLSVGKKPVNSFDDMIVEDLDI